MRLRANLFSLEDFLQRPEATEQNIKIYFFLTVRPDFDF